MSRTLHELEKMNPVFKTLWGILSKNGDIRYIRPLMKDIYTFKLLPRDIEGRVFPLNNSSISVLFLRAARRAKVVDIHLHNLWYMALTRMSSRFKNI